MTQVFRRGSQKKIVDALFFIKNSLVDVTPENAPGVFGAWFELLARLYTSRASINEKVVLFVLNGIWETLEILADLKIPIE